MTKVTVKFNNKVVGYIVEQENKKIAFQYDELWIENGFSISPLSLPLKKDIFVCNKDVLEGLYGVLFDSLPDGWGALLISRLLQRKGLNYKSLSPLTKLTLINDNGLGGLSYEPTHQVVRMKGEYDLDVLSKEIDEILNGDSENSSLDDIFYLGGSSGGTRPKAHVRINGEDWIVKFPCRIDPHDIGKKEYMVNELAKSCEIRVNDHMLFGSKICSGYFGAKRFDRSNGKRYHVISLAGIYETSHRMPNMDYGHLFNLIESINGDKEELYEAFRRMCFNIYISNKDDHSKNFSFIYDEDIKKYRLSPAYDLTVTNDKFEHEMTANGSSNPTDEDILSLAKDFNMSIKRCKDIMNTIKQEINKSKL